MKTNTPSRGGKRIGAGRKPSAVKLKTVSAKIHPDDALNLNRICSLIGTSQAKWITHKIRQELSVDADSWISVKTILPDYMRAVLVYCPNTLNVYCAYYCFYSGRNDTEKKPLWCFFDTESGIKPVREKVTHWMPLPPPPVELPESLTL